ncbi:hypothetical protein [Bacteroides finegoldii]|nr:hypothetical protein [Bacteroides finegoldii]
MEKDINSILYAESMKVALRVDFLINSEELKLYAVSIYNASIWGKKIDKKNKALKKNRQLK